MVDIFFPPDVVFQLGFRVYTNWRAVSEYKLKWAAVSENAVPTTITILFSFSENVSSELYHSYQKNIPNLIRIIYYSLVRFCLILFDFIINQAF